MSMVHAGQQPATPARANTAAPSLRSLPLWAQVAIERLNACTALRNQSMLDELLTGYARTYGAAVPSELRTEVRQICLLRFGESYVSEPGHGSERSHARPTSGPATAASLAQSLLQHAELLAIVSLAQQAGVVWLKFDADAMEVDGLPTYPYEEADG